MSVCVRSDLCLSLELPLQNASICALNLPCRGPTLGGVSLTVLDSCYQLSCPGISDIHLDGLVSRSLDRCVGLEPLYESEKFILADTEDLEELAIRPLDEPVD
jgi:hypothetical protein